MTDTKYTLADVSTAAAIRDLVIKIATDTLNTERPAYSYATVVSVNADASTAMVLFNNDTTPIPAKIGSIVPTMPADGSAGPLVRVDGLPGDRFIEDVLGPCTVRDYSSTQVGKIPNPQPPPPGGGPPPPAITGSSLSLTGGSTAITGLWTKDATATGGYHLQVSPSATFASGVIDGNTYGTILTLTGLAAGTYYGRVASINNTGKQGPWSGTAVGTVTDSANVGPAPSAAVTNITVTGGFGFLYAKWTPPAGNALSYEVHVSTSASFTPSSSTLVLTSPAPYAFIKASDSAGTALAYSTTYYVIIIPKNKTGSGPASSAVASSNIVQITTTDITPTSITSDLILGRTIVAGDIAASTLTGYEINAINLNVGSYVRSNSYTPGAAGWTINADGSAEFNNVTVRGSVVAGGTVNAANITLAAGGTIRTSTYQGVNNGNHIELDASTYYGDGHRLRFYSGLYGESEYGVASIRSSASNGDLVISGSSYFGSRIHLAGPIAVDGNITVGSSYSLTIGYVYGTAQYADGAKGIAPGYTLPGSQISGTVPNATYANSAGSVDTANNATYARYAGQYGSYNSFGIYGGNSLNCDNFYYASGGQFTFYGNMYVTGSVYSNTSSRLVKTNIVPLTTPDDNIFESIHKLVPVRFNKKNYDFKEGNDFPIFDGTVESKQRIGFIAEDVQEVFPEVTEMATNILRLDYGALVPVLVEAIQRLDRRVIELEAQSPLTSP